MKKEDSNKVPESDIVVSSRIRLARNCIEFPFPARLNVDGAVNIIQKIKTSAVNAESPLAKKLVFIDSTKMPSLDKACLVEKHLISKEFASKKEVTGLILSKDETISLMINEEDHLRIQVIMPGLLLDKCWDTCNEVDNLIEKNIEYAFSDQLGYLTSCPTNVGTGLRVSVMVHLPAMTILGSLRNIFDTINKFGVTVRGLYGEGSEFMGNMYQISNQISLGQSEEEIITKINIIVNKIIDQENMSRKKLLESKIQLEDRIFRSYGVFSNARILSSNECMKLLSDVRLGIELDIIKDIGIETINELITITQPANLQKYYGSILNPVERDMKRAELVRHKLASDS